VPIASATRVVFLQHPRESRVAIGTCRMAHLALAGSELHRGVSFETHSRVGDLAADTSGAVAVLYPGDDACAPELLTGARPRTLIVLDGTWHQARAMWRANPALHRLPRIGFVPSTPGNYRIRREPAPHCLATVEAVAEVLGRLEGDPARFRPMLRAFDRMVEQHLFYRRLRPNQAWRRRKRHRQPRPSPVRTALHARRADLVVVYGEANAPPIHADAALRAGAGDTAPPPADRCTVAPELVHLVACRPASGERFVSVIAPRRPLAPSMPEHLMLSPADLYGGEAVDAALARWRAFLRSTDLVCVWGSFTIGLLRDVGDADRATFDLRDAATRELRRRPGGIEAAAALLADGAVPAAWTRGRAGPRIAALAAIAMTLAG
jgi:DTW domain-containing protein YfiP